MSGTKQSNQALKYILGFSEFTIPSLLPENTFLYSHRVALNFAILNGVVCFRFAEAILHHGAENWNLPGCTKDKLQRTI